MMRASLGGPGQFDRLDVGSKCPPICLLDEEEEENDNCFESLAEESAHLKRSEPACL